MKGKLKVYKLTNIGKSAAKGVGTPTPRCSRISCIILFEGGLDNLKIYILNPRTTTKKV